MFVFNFFFIEFYKYYLNNNKNIIFYLIFLNLVLAFPAFYYVFILDVFFIDYGGLSSNYYNKILIISSIIIFHLIPFLLFTKNLFTLKLNKNIYLISLIFIFFIFAIKNFDYNLIYSGGGIILHISDLLLENNYIFYLFSFFSIFMLLNFCKINLKKNLIIISILFLMVPQYHIFHKYYDPLVIILFLTIVEIDFNFKKIKNLYFLIIIYVFYTLLYLIYLINNTLVIK